VHFIFHLPPLTSNSTVHDSENQYGPPQEENPETKNRNTETGENRIVRSVPSFAVEATDVTVEYRLFNFDILGLGKSVGRSI
jgi:hypothetical protein